MLTFAGSVVKVYKVFNNTTLIKNEYADTEIVQTGTLSGFFTLQWDISGGSDGANCGVVKFVPWITLNGLDYIESPDIIAFDQTKTTGPAANGKNFASFELDICSNFFIRATETANLSFVLVSAWIKAV